MTRRGIVGNHFDKYTTSNPVERVVVQRFLATVGDLFVRQRPATVLEVGCGEGKLAHHLVANYHRPQRFVACDLSLEQVVPSIDDQIEFRESSIYDLPDADATFDLVVCCEVLEHLERPAAGLAELARVAKHGVLLSAPREPLWRVLNMARGKYWRALGNTPDHIQHFGRRALVRLAATRLDVVAVRSPIPWTVILGRTRHARRG